MTRARTVSSVADAGKEDRNSDIWVHESPKVKTLRGGRTTDSSSGGLRPCLSACPAKILRATGSFCPRYLSWMFCFDNSFSTGISCLHKQGVGTQLFDPTRKGRRGGKVVVPVWAVRAAVAFSLGVERTYMWPVALVVRLRPRQLLQHLPACRRRPTVIQLILASSKLHICVKHA